MNRIPESLRQGLKEYHQDHVLRWEDSLGDAEHARFMRQLESLDLPLLSAVWQKQSAGASASSSNAESDRRKTAAARRIEQATAPKSIVRQPENMNDRELWQQAAAAGERLLSESKVAVVTVAGGQGTRLGFDHPKGMFPIGPVSDRTLFQIFAEQILARRRRHQAQMPWILMTSDATHQETIDFFDDHDHFGLGRDTVHFAKQGSLPALDAKSGRILLCDRGSLCLSPDGHGGLISALHDSGVLDRMTDQGIEHLFYHQVDNPTAILCDPALLGFHLLHKSSLTTNVVRKVKPDEKMGVLVDVGGRTEIIEYSELSDSQVTRVGEDGDWIFWAGNTAIHVFTCAFLNSLARNTDPLPLHVARKQVAFLDDSGTLIVPEKDGPANGIKLERFIFDALPLAPRTLVVEGNRAREFNPVKNRDGADSPETARAALTRIGREWQVAAGLQPDPELAIEISPLEGLDSEEFVRRMREQSILLDNSCRQRG